MWLVEFFGKISGSCIVWAFHLKNWSEAVSYANQVNRNFFTKPHVFRVDRYTKQG